VVGRPARYLATTFGCKVTGVDLNPDFIDAAIYLTALCGLSDHITLEVGNGSICLSKSMKSSKLPVPLAQHQQKYCSNPQIRCIVLAVCG
jgi:hypothetical protein